MRAYLTVLSLWATLCVFKAQAANPEVTISSTVPAVNQTDGKIHAVSGSQLEISCRVTSLPRGALVRWKMIKQDGDTWPIATDQIVVDNRKYKVTKPAANIWKLTISSLRSDDAAFYVCYIQTTISQKVEQKIEVVITVPPRIVPEETSDSVTVREGDKVSLQCGAVGTPTPSYTWTRENHGLIPRPVNDKTYKGKSLVLENVRRTASGQYTCTAHNGVGDNVTALVVLHVMFPHTFRADKTRYWQVKDQFQEVTLACYATGYPKPRVSWQKKDENGKITYIKETKYKYEMSTWNLDSNNEYPTSLTIKNVNQYDYGTYTCGGRNGASIKFMESFECLGQHCYELPWKFSFRSPVQGTYSKKYRLEWRDETHQMPTEYIIYIKQALDLNWNHTLMKAHPPSDDGINLYNYTFTGLKESTAYNAKLQAKNHYGVSKKSREFAFRTGLKDVSVKDQSNCLSKETYQLCVILLSFVIRIM